MWITLWMLIFFIAPLCSGDTGQSISKKTTKRKSLVFSNETKVCLGCHTGKTPGLVLQWENSDHYESEIGCFECHKANPGEKDAFSHEGYLISVIVSPNDCANCHREEVREFFESAHSAAAGLVLGPVGQLVGDDVFGNAELKTPAFPKGASAASVNGCWRCHGCKVAVDKNGKPDPATWPNMGVGRINPDGSKGSCSACHAGHTFSVAQARRPESCKECHSGGASLYEYQMYMQSKHGILYAVDKKGMNLDAVEWIPGKTYYAAPTCSTCHMYQKPDKINGNRHVTHNIDQNFAFDKKTNKLVFILSKNMENVCKRCHSKGLYKNLARQAEAEAKLVVNKWGTPVKNLYCLAIALLNEMSPEAERLLKNKKWDKPMRKFLRMVADQKYYTCNNPVDYSYISLGQYVRVARLAAFHISPQFVEDYNKALAADFFSTYIPRLRELVAIGQKFPPGSKSIVLANRLEMAIHKLHKKATYGKGWLNVPLTDCPQKDNKTAKKNTK